MLKLLEKNIGGKSEDIGPASALNRNPISQEIDPSIGKWDYMKSEIFCKAKESVGRMNRQCLEWEKSLSAIFQTWLTNQMCK